MSTWLDNYCKNLIIELAKGPSLLGSIVCLIWKLMSVIALEFILNSWVSIVLEGKNDAANPQIISVWFGKEVWFFPEFSYGQDLPFLSSQTDWLMGKVTRNGLRDRGKPTWD